MQRLTHGTGRVAAAVEGGVPALPTGVVAGGSSDEEGEGGEEEQKGQLWE